MSQLDNIVYHFSANMSIVKDGFYNICIKISIISFFDKKRLNEIRKSFLKMRAKIICSRSQAIHKAL